MNQPTLFEYTSAAIPIIDELKPEFLLHDTQKTILTPNLYIKYLHINEHTIYDHDLRTASSHVFYVIKGNGCTTFNDQSIEDSGRWWIGLYSPESDQIVDRKTSNPVSI